MPATPTAKKKNGSASALAQSPPPYLPVPTFLPTGTYPVDRPTAKKKMGSEAYTSSRDDRHVAFDASRLAGSYTQTDTPPQWTKRRQSEHVVLPACLMWPFLDIGSRLLRPLHSAKGRLPPRLARQGHGRRSTAVSLTLPPGVSLSVVRPLGGQGDGAAACLMWSILRLLHSAKGLVLLPHLARQGLAIAHVCHREQHHATAAHDDRHNNGHGGQAAGHAVATSSAG